jgi:hypothetical protein
VKARRERLLYVGPALQATPAAFITAAEDLASANGGERVVIVGNQPRDYDFSTGELEDQPGYYLAAFAAGYKSAHRPEESLTNKAITLPGMSFVFDDEEIEQLLEAGVMVCNYDSDQGRNLIVYGITSYTADATHTLRQVYGMDSMDYLNKKIRLRVAPFVGKVGDRTLVQSIKLAAEGVLIEETRGLFGVLTPGTDPVTKEDVPSYENLQAVFDGMSVTGVTFECHPVGSNDFVFATATFTPVQIAA